MTTFHFLFLSLVSYFLVCLQRDSKVVCGPRCCAHSSPVWGWFAPHSSWSPQDSPGASAPSLPSMVLASEGWRSLIASSNRPLIYWNPEDKRACWLYFTKIVDFKRGPRFIPGFTCYAQSVTRKTDMGDTGSEGSKPPSNFKVIPPRCPCGFWG